MPLQDLSDDREPQPRPADGAIGRGPACERLEERALRRRWDSHAFITHGDDRTPGRVAMEPQTDSPAGGRVFEGVGDEVDVSGMGRRSQDERVLSMDVLGIVGRRPQ